eukprot:m51a1_g8818 putative kinase family protein (1013) ;mRNA; r:320878-325196
MPVASQLLSASTLLLAVAAATCFAASCGRGAASNGELVIGVSSDRSLMQQGAVQGLRAAVAEASRYTRLRLRVVNRTHSSEHDLVRNVRALIEDECAFVVVGKPGTSATEAQILELLKNHSVPLVSPMSGSENLRDASKHVATFTRQGGGAVTLPVVVNIRASAGDEMNIILSLLCSDWETMPFVSLVAQDTPQGNWSRVYVDRSLANLNVTGLLSHHLFKNESPKKDELDEAERALFAGDRQPRTLIVCTTPNVTVPLVRRLARRHAGLKVFLLSWASAADLRSALDDETKRILASNRVQLFFTQSMPFPTPAPEQLARSTALIRSFNAANTKLKTHAALEGYLTGWFIYEAAQQAAARNGRNITRGDFLHTVFVDVRTFNVLGMTLGPYGDGGISGGTSSTQSAEERCNQGVREVFITQFDPFAGLRPVQGGSLPFSGCNAPRWYLRKAITTFGLVVAPGSREDLLTQRGIIASMQDFSTDGSDTVVVRSVAGEESNATTKEKLVASNAVGVVCPRLESADTAKLLGRMPLFSPMPGFWKLRRPFDRNVINLFPSSYDEMAAAYHFFRDKLRVHRVAVVANDRTNYTQDCSDGARAMPGLFGNQTGFIFDVIPEVPRDLAAFVREGAYEGFVVLGGTFSPGAWARTYRIGVTPPLSLYASTSSLRRDYNTWVPLEEAGDASFSSFIAGKFLTQVVAKAKEARRETLTAQDLVDAVYDRRVFELEGLSFRGFDGSCSDDRDCCNQGLDTVYILRGTDSGRGTVEFVNVRRGELELGKCMGQGRFGSMYMADWHGTTVAVRMIDKKATPKEDQRLIKEEVLLLHKHHHPNLLMLMGYCETRNEIFVVTEFMEGGTLADFLRKEKHLLSMHALVSMAFDVIKGIAYLHSCKPPIVHGSISTHNLLVQPERRPSVFQILRNWPATFAALGNFEVPKELNLDSPLCTAEALPHWTSGVNSNNAVKQSNPDQGEDSSMVSFMPVMADSDALQTPHQPEQRLSIVSEQADIFTTLPQ